MKHLSKIKILAGILAILLLVGCASQQNSLTYHQNLQKELTYDNAINDSQAFTIKSYREDINDLQKKLKELNKKNNTFQKKQALEAEMARIRTLIQELEQQMKE